jgi:hypothetical protein
MDTKLRRSPLGLTVVVGLSFAAACGEPFPVEVAVQAPKGADISNVSAVFNGGDPYILANGSLKVMVKMSAGEKLSIAIRLPDHLAAPEGVSKTFLLTEGGDGKPTPIRYVIPVEEKVSRAKYLLTLEDGCAGQEVSVNGDPAGKVDEDRAFSYQLKKAKGERARITMTAHGSCQTRVCDLTLGESDRINLNAECPSLREGVEPIQEEPEPVVNVEPIIKKDPIAKVEPIIKKEPIEKPQPIEKPHLITKVEPATKIEPVVKMEPVKNLVETPPNVVPKGSVPVKVTCIPAGMELVIDDKLALSSCGENSTAYVIPDGKIHSFRVHPAKGQPACDRNEPVVRSIPKKGPIAPLTIVAECGDCLKRLSGMASNKKSIPEADLGCLAKIGEASEGYLEAQLLFAHVLDTQKKDAKRAEEILTKLVASAKGQSSPEAYYRLADLIGRRKDYAKQREYADKAWMYRKNFSADLAGQNKMLGVRKQRAGAYEGLFYAKGERGYFDKALAEYALLEEEAKAVKSSEKWTQLAKEGRARLEEQEKLGKVNLEK